jgi:hypothetical protein
MDQKLEYLEDANKILSESINVDSDRNWFAYTTRIQVGLDIAGDPLSVWHQIDSLMLDVDSVLILQIQVHSRVS